MNTETITQIKDKYRQHLSTPEGREQLTKAIEIKKMWKQQVAMTDIQVNTASIKSKFLPTELKNKITKITITPIGLNNMCHLTSDLLCDTEKGITKRIGYNITACPCGRLMSYEIHSVNKCGEQLYDFTRDFNDETEKYFLEMDTDMSADTFIQMFGNKPIMINKGCKCPCWLDDVKQYEKKETELVEHINEIEDMIIVNTRYGTMIRRK